MPPRSGRLSDPHLRKCYAILSAADAAEARGDAAAALDVMAPHQFGPDGQPFWAPWRVRMLAEILDAGPALPRWAVSRWILAQALRHLPDNSNRMRRALQVAIDLRGGVHLLQGVDQLDALCHVKDHDWVYRQVFLHDLGGLRHFLRHGATPDLLAGADRIREWVGASLGGYRLLDDGRWQDLGSGEELELLDLGARSYVRSDDCVLGRVVPIASGAMFETAPLTVPESVAVEVTRNRAGWLDALRRGCLRYGVGPCRGIATPEGAIVLAGAHDYALLTDESGLGWSPTPRTTRRHQGPPDAA